MEIEKGITTLRVQLSKINNLTDDAFLRICEISIPVKLNSKFTLSEIQASQSEIFVKKGILRCYFSSATAKEYTATFFKEGEFVTPAFARRSNGKSTMVVQALEDCDLLLFDELKFTKLRYEFADVRKLGGKVIEHELAMKSIKEGLLATGDLKNLYVFFTENFGDLESRIAQKYVASYLGADPVSLSRLKRQMLEESRL